MSEIWAGEVGLTKHWCPFCDFLWDTEFKHEYDEHMNAHGPPTAKGHMVVTAIDKEKATVTFFCEKENSDDL